MMTVVSLPAPLMSSDEQAMMIVCVPDALGLSDDEVWVGY